MTHPRPARHRPRRWCLSAARRLRHPLPVSLQLQQGFSIGIAAARPDPPDTLALTKTSFFPNVSLFSSFSHSKTVTLKITDDAPMSQRESEQRTHMFWLGVCNTHTSVENEQTFQYQHAMWRFRMPGRVSWKEIAGCMSPQERLGLVRVVQRDVLGRPPHHQSDLTRLFALLVADLVPEKTKNKDKPEVIRAI